MKSTARIRIDFGDGKQAGHVLIPITRQDLQKMEQSAAVQNLPLAHWLARELKRSIEQLPHSAHR